MKKILCAFILLFIFVAGALSAENDELNMLRAKMTSKVDDIENTKYIQTKTAHRAFKKIFDKNGALFEVELSQDTITQKVTPVIYIYCTKNGSPLLLKKIVVNVDKQVFRINLHGGNTHFSRFPREDRSIDLAVISATPHEDLIKAIIKGQVVKIRLSGYDDSYDFELEPEFKQALADIWRLYELMQ